MFPRRPFTSTITTDHVYVNVPESERVNSIYWIVFSVRVKICLKSGFSDTIRIRVKIRPDGGFSDIIHIPIQIRIATLEENRIFCRPPSRIWIVIQGAEMNKAGIRIKEASGEGEGDREGGVGIGEDVPEGIVVELF